jgi:hypothetical protein
MPFDTKPVPSNRHVVIDVKQDAAASKITPAQATAYAMSRIFPEFPHNHVNKTSAGIAEAYTTTSPITIGDFKLQPGATALKERITTGLSAKSILALGTGFPLHASTFRKILHGVIAAAPVGISNILTAGVQYVGSKLPTSIGKPLMGFCERATMPLTMLKADKHRYEKEIAAQRAAAAAAAAQPLNAEINADHKHQINPSNSSYLSPAAKLFLKGAITIAAPAGITIAVYYGAWQLYLLQGLAAKFGIALASGKTITLGNHAYNLIDEQLVKPEVMAALQQATPLVQPSDLVPAAAPAPGPSTMPGNSVLSSGTPPYQRLDIKRTPEELEALERAKMAMNAYSKAEEGQPVVGYAGQTANAATIVKVFGAPAVIGAANNGNVSRLSTGTPPKQPTHATASLASNPSNQPAAAAAATAVQYPNPVASAGTALLAGVGATTPGARRNDNSVSGVNAVVSAVPPSAAELADQAKSLGLNMVVHPMAVPN